jgi:predicted ester cyclase
MSNDTNKAFITRYFDAIRRDKSQKTLDQFIAESELKEHILMFETSFPGYWLDAEDLIAEGDQVAVRGKVRGVHNGPMMGIASTGKTVSVSTFITYRIANGKIVEHWMLVDMPELQKQLEATPAVARA